MRVFSSTSDQILGCIFPRGMVAVWIMFEVSVNISWNLWEGKGRYWYQTQMKSNLFSGVGFSDGT